MQTPVLLLVFNRPDTTRRVFEAVRKVRPSTLYVAADGPRAHVPGDQGLCDETRAIFARPDWDCEVKSLFREENLGCKAAVSQALGWFFENVEEGVVLEDDCVPHDSFFRYCSAMLSRYRHDERVMMVAGTNYLIVPESYSYSYFFSRYCPIWGWATWRRAWKLYDARMPEWPARRESDELGGLLGSKARVDLYRRIFDRAYYGRVNTWDYQWMYSCLFQNGLCAIPKYNLVSNIGNEGTHAATASEPGFLHMPLQDAGEELTHPPAVYPDERLNSRLLEIVGAQARREAPRIVRDVVRAASRFKHRVLRRARQMPQVVALPASSSVMRGRALLSYVRDSVLLSESDQSLDGHSNRWESREIAQILSRLGFQTDVIDYFDAGFRPEREYDVVIDIHGNLQRLAPFLSPRTIKILHITGSYPGYSTRKELERIADLETRRNALYTPKRVVDSVMFDRSLEIADACTLIGNEWTLNTFPPELRKKITPVSVSASRLSGTKLKNEYCKPGKNDFLWFFGAGLVHKGLDLTLEAFAASPELKLHVVGPVLEEPDFVQIYEKELFHTANIQLHGYMTPSGREFQDVLAACSCFVAPSCSEGTSPAVATLLQVGLYPIITRDTGITLPNGCGLYLEDVSAEGIRTLAHKVRTTPRETLEEQILEIQAEATMRYSRAAFSKEMEDFLTSQLTQVARV